MIEFKDIVLKNVIIALTPIENEVGSLQGINFKFNEVSHDYIYQTSEGKVVQRYPREIGSAGINLDLKAVIDLSGAFIGNISTYLYDIRKELNQGEMNLLLKTSLDKEISLKIHTTKHFFREGTKGRYKIDLSILENDPDFGIYEKIMFSFTKKDVQALIFMIKDILSSYNRSRPLIVNASRINYETSEEIEEVIVPIIKVDNSIVIDNIWLHGQEILNLMYVIDKLVYGLHIESNLDFLNTFYRQIQVTNSNGIVYLTLKKMSSNHTEETIKASNGESCKIRIQITAQSLSILYLFLSIEILKHAEIDFEFDSKTEVLGSSDPFLKTKGIKYHISLKESFLGLAINTKKKEKAGELIKRDIISLTGKVKENAYNIITEDGDVLTERYEKNGELLSVLTDFNIDLKHQWPKLIKGLSLAYTKEYKTEEKNFNLMKFFVVNQTNIGVFKYEFSILSNEGNKASAILTINKYRIQNKEDIFVSSYRQPLFDRYIYQLLTIILASAEFIPDLEFIDEVNKKDLILYRYKSMKQVTKLTKSEIVKYGLKKVEGISYWGIFSENNKMFTELTVQDQYLLNQSSYSRLFRGFWQPFVGEFIAVGPDRYLTDTFGEINLEQNKVEGINNFTGIDWATKLYFGTLS